MIDSLLDRVGELDTVWLLLLAFFLPFGETVALLDVLVPGEVGLVLLGAAAARADVSVIPIIAVGSLGAFCGDSVSWLIGRRWGLALLRRWEPVWARVEPAVDLADEHFAKHGGKAVFVGRFVGALRALVPLVAGTARLEYRRFAPWNFAASISWVTLVVILGAVFGETVVPVVDRAGPIISAIVVVAIGVAVWRYLGHRRRRARR